MKEILNQFNNDRYGNYQALTNLADLWKEKIYLQKVLRQIGIIIENHPQASKFLEIGCADGSFSALVRERYKLKIVGLDIAEEAVKQARRIGLEAQVANLEDGLPFPEHSFDIVVATEVIEHVYDTDFFLAEIKRVLTPRGYVILSTPNLASLKNRFRLLFGKYPQYSEYHLGQDTAGHIRNYTVAVLRKQLQTHHFEINKIISPNILCPVSKNIPLFIKKIAMWLGDIFYTLGSHIIIVAQRSLDK